ncbi:hypothetical protein GE21DRAFT_1313080 [Neurospora crassa]|nr:hypothetical protein GE21DRAFT_1313080 [Neurospora crassa]
MTAFFPSSIRHWVHFSARDGRGAICIAKEKVAFWSCYSNPHGSHSDHFFAFWPIIDRYAAPSSLAALGGPMDHDLWCGSSMSPFGPRQRSSSKAWAS